MCAVALSLTLCDVRRLWACHHHH